MYDMGTFSPYCDLDDGDVGWTRIMMHTSDAVDFYKTWSEYSAGFGDTDADHWLGLDAVHNMTTEQNMRLRVEIGYTVYDSAGAPIREVADFANYESFAVGSSTSNYQLSSEHFTCHTPSHF